MARIALPARFDGRLFRSHTEAKWAVFLKHLDIKYDYEEQGFATDGVGYLPDFYIFTACGTVWVEVKGSWEADPEGIAKWRSFAAQRPNPAVTRAALLVGAPCMAASYLVIGGDEASDDPLKGPWEDEHQWRPCPSGYHFDLAYAETFRTKFAEDGCPDEFGRGGDERIANAVEAALSFRFGRPVDETAA